MSVLQRCRKLVAGAVVAGRNADTALAGCLALMAGVTSWDAAARRKVLVASVGWQDEHGRPTWESISRWLARLEKRAEAEGN